MSVDLDQTEELLARLEAELAQKQSQLDARVERERVQVDALKAQRDGFAAECDKAGAEFQQRSADRDALMETRDALRVQGSKGSPVLAALWATAATVLTAGAVMPLVALGAKGNLFFGALLGGGFALAVGWWIAALLARKPE